MTVWLALTLYLKDSQLNVFAQMDTMMMEFKINVKLVKKGVQLAKMV